ncbi:MAG: uracil-DNA glycosylase [Actinomycetota bacterium]|nr:uracil-DNA glycosylase [Actinomycetota bacterium]
MSVVPSYVETPALAAPRCGSWAELAVACGGCVACPELVASRRHVVPGACPPGADVLLVGEAPGAQEDETGQPFVGRSGQLLDELLAAAGIARAGVAVANTVKCRPPGNRTPRRSELVACRPWLERQIELADPLLVVTLGGTAASWVLGPGARLGASRGVLHDYGGRPVLVTYHPSAAIRFGPNGAPRAALAEDLITAAAHLTRLRASTGGRR